MSLGESLLNESLFPEYTQAVYIAYACFVVSFALASSLQPDYDLGDLYVNMSSAVQPVLQKSKGLLTKSTMVDEVCIINNNHIQIVNKIGMYYTVEYLLDYHSKPGVFNLFRIFPLTFDPMRMLTQKSRSTTFFVNCRSWYLVSAVSPSAGSGVEPSTF